MTSSRSLIFNGKNARLRQWLLLAHIASLVLLGLGWTLDALTIRIIYNVPFLGGIELMDETRSVISTLQKLWNTNNVFPLILIGLFGILIPLVKTWFIFQVILQPQEKTVIARAFVSGISKWAMADVFAISILISFFAASAMDYTNAIFRAGFYYFAAYVLMSNCIVMFLPRLNLVSSRQSDSKQSVIDP